MDWSNESFLFCVIVVVFLLSEMIVRIVQAIANGRRRPEYRAELGVSDPSGHEGKVTVAFDTAAALNTFVDDREKSRGWTTKP